MGSLKESYSKMFSLPRKELLVLATCLLTVINGYLFTWLRPLSFVFLVIGAPYFLLLVLVLPKEKRILNLKRTIFLVLLLELSLFVYGLGTLVFATQLFAFGVYLTLGLSFIAFLATVDTKNIYIVLLTIFVGESICVGLTNPIYGGSSIFFLMLNAVMFVYSFLFYISFVYGGETTFGETRVSLFEFLKAYLFLHFRDRRDLIESIFEDASVEREIPVIATLFLNDEKPVLALVSMPIHPGPLRNCGSSRLPLHLYEAIEKELGCKTVFLKGAGSHDSNIPSDTLTKKVALKVASVLKKNINRPCSDAMPFPKVIHSGIINSTIIDTCDNRYILVTSHPNPTDDIDVNLSYLAFEMGKLSKKNVALVDMHNSLTVPETGKKMSIDDPGYKDILKVLVNSLYIKPNPPQELHAGVARGHCRGIGLYEGLGPLGIVVASFDIGGKNYFIVEFDSNNITPELHDAIIEALNKKYNAELVSIVSTDTHMVTGVTHKTIYTILGQLKPDRILECTLELAERAYQSMKRVKILTVTSHLTTKVLGVDAQTQLFSIATESVKLATKLFKITLMSATLVAIAILL